MGYVDCTTEVDPFQQTFLKRRMINQITKKQLLNWGMRETKHPAYPLEKVLHESGSGKVSVIISLVRNVTELALNMPDGGLIFLNVQSIEDLERLEEILGEYEPE